MDSLRPPPQLTIAVPTFNGAEHLAETLRSILGNFPDHPSRLIVCDDRSEDDTLDLVRREAGDRARIVVNPRRLGLAGNWNRCAELAETPLLAIVHQDDTLLPGHLAAHVAAFDRHPGLGMSCGAIEVVDASGRPIPPTVIERPDLGPADRLFPPGAFVAELASRNPVRCSTVVLRAEALRSVGGFDPSYRYAVDWECWLRIARAWPVAWLARPSVSVRWHSESETHRLHRGTIDLDEVAEVFDQIHTHYAHLLPDPRSSRRAGNRHLALAFLNRSLDALHAADPHLARLGLRRALSYHPLLLARILADPRLSAQMAALSLSPRLACHLFRKATPPPPPPS